MRIRTIKPEFWTDEHVMSVSFQSRLLFIGLWQIADREGRLKEEPVSIKAKLFPCDDVYIPDLIEELIVAGLVRRYAVDGRRLLVIPGFAAHQNVNPREIPSVLPAPNLTGADPDPHASDLDPHGSDLDLQRVSGKGRERKGRSNARVDEKRGSALLDPEGAVGSPSEPPAEVLLTFPCVGKTPSWDLTKPQVELWQSIYGTLDVLQSCKRALAWIDGNPRNRKTADGMKRFLVNWFNTDVRKGWNGRTSEQAQPTKRAPMSEEEKAALRAELQERRTRG